MAPPLQNNSFSVAGMLSLTVVFFTCAVSCISAEQMPLRIVSSYQSPPGTVNVILQNNSVEPMNLELRELGAPDEELTIPFWWSKVVDNPIAPGARTRMIISMTRPVAEGKELKLRLLANQKKFALALTSHFRKPFIQYMVQDTQSGKIYIYLVNITESPIAISDINLNGYTLQSGNTTPPVQLSPHRGSMIFGECPALIVSEGGVLSVLVDYNMGNETLTEASYLFSSTQFTLGMEGTQNFILDCPTHKQGGWMEVGPKILKAAASSIFPVPTVHFCRDRLAQGLPAFAQATPRIKINPQASNLNRGKDNALSGYFDVLKMAREYARPGIATMLIENTSIFSGAFGALRNPDDPPLSEHELLMVSLGAFAHGAKGLEFRVLESDGEEYARRVQYLLIRFELLRSFLSVGEVLPLEVQNPSDKITIHTMVCGDKGLLVFIFRKDYLDTATLPPSEISVTVPNGLTLDTYTEISVGAERGSLAKLGNNTYALTVNNLNAASVYFCVTTQ